MRLLFILAAVLNYSVAIAQAASAEHSIQVSGAPWSEGHCVNLPGVGIRMPIRFFSTPTFQEIRIDRVTRYNNWGRYCSYMISIADASNETTSGQIASLWEEPGPGLVFSDYHWHSPSLAGAFDIRIDHIRPFMRDQIIVTEIIEQAKKRDTIVDLWISNRLDQPINLVHIASPGPLTLQPADDGFAVTTLGHTLHFVLDSDTQQLKLLEPTKQNILLFDSMKELALKLSF